MDPNSRSAVRRGNNKISCWKLQQDSVRRLKSRHETNLTTYFNPWSKGDGLIGKGFCPVSMKTRVGSVEPTPESPAVECTLVTFCSREMKTRGFLGGSLVMRDPVSKNNTEADGVSRVIAEVAHWPPPTFKFQF